MAGLNLKHIYKIYPSRDKRQKEGVLAVKDFNLDITDNEFVVFVGPSGCGKSTTLRMIAGLEEISSGELYIDGQYMNDVEAKDRNIAMVFQNYALYPHMTAYKNIAFGLTLRKYPEPIYDTSNELVVSVLEKIKGIDAEIKVMLKESKKLSNKLIPVSKKLMNKRKLVDDISYDFKLLSEKNSKRKDIQEKLVKLNSAKEKLQLEIKNLESTKNDINNQVAQIRNDIISKNKEIIKLKDSIKDYQLKVIDEKQIKRYKKNLAYYEKLSVKDNIRYEKDITLLEKNENDLNDAKAYLNELKATNQDTYKTEIAIESINDEIKFLKEEIDILNQRKESIQKNLNDSKEKLDFYQNNPQLAYKYRHYSKEEIDYKVKKAANILDINELLDRKPREMSGGQRQRIALGRAIVREPKVFLLDEPLSNLDAKLRASMRSEITKLHKQLSTTFIYVTHDQVEAMTMGTRIVVMNKGIIQQVDTPTNLFDYPDNTFVAGFIGTPQMNFFSGTITVKEKKVEFVLKGNSKIKLTFNKDNLRTIKKEYCDGLEHEVVLGIRGENILIDDKSPLKVDVNLVEILGSEMHLHTSLVEDKEHQEKEEIVVKLATRVSVEQSAILGLTFDDTKIHLFDKKTTLSIMEREPK